MNFETSKIQLEITPDKIIISDRMPLNWLDIGLFIGIAYAALGLILGPSGLIIASLLSLGYIFFRYFAWLIWKQIDINLCTKTISVKHMFLAQNTSTEIISEKFDLSKLCLHEFEQSNMKRAMIQFNNHKINDLMLLTHLDDIQLIKTKVFKSSLTEIGMLNF
jgi:hypothetical protein